MDPQRWTTPTSQQEEMDSTSYAPTQGQTMIHDHHNNAMSSSPAVAPPPSISTTIARSMSRYKGARQANRPIGVPMPLRQVPQAYGAGEPGNITEEQFISRALRNEKTYDSRPTTSRANTADGERPGPRLDTVAGSSDHINSHTNGVSDSQEYQHLKQPRAPFTDARIESAQHQSWPMGESFATSKNVDLQTNIHPESNDSTPNKAPWATSAKGTPARFDTFNKRSSRTKLEISKPMPLDLSHDEIRVHRQDRANKRDSYSPRSPKSPLAHKRWSGSSREEIKKMISKPIPVAEPPTISTPRYDAPVSAAQGVDQKIKIKYKDETVYAPVTAATTPTELIRYAQTQIPEMASQQHLVMLESFKRLGLERPLRKYELIRDILNAWDADSHNYLSIVPSPSAGNDEDLTASTAPKTQPEETTIHLYHSQKPGNWDKRYITLRTDGQMYYSKKLGGEGISMCHLSDYDIYVPTARELKKRIKPPKNACFAVKSQQRSSIFVSTENFVHFFSTSDKKVAARWYKAIQEWRSWYLVHMLDQGRAGVSPSPGMKKNGMPSQKNHGDGYRPSSSDAYPTRKISTRNQYYPSSSPTRPQTARNHLDTTSGNRFNPLNHHHNRRTSSSDSPLETSTFPLPPNSNSANNNNTHHSTTSTTFSTLLNRATSTTTPSSSNRNGALSSMSTSNNHHSTSSNSKLKPAGNGTYAPTLSRDFSLGSTTLVQDGTGGLKRGPSNAFRRERGGGGGGGMGVGGGGGGGGSRANSRQAEYLNNGQGGNNNNSEGTHRSAASHSAPPAPPPPPPPSSSSQPAPQAPSSSSSSQQTPPLITNNLNNNAPPPPPSFSSTNGIINNPPKPVPLVDLTPTYTPPPQHTRKGRGVRPEVIPAGGLIDLANSKVEEKIKIPETRAWQKQGQIQMGQGSAGDGLVGGGYAGGGGNGSGGNAGVKGGSTSSGSLVIEGLAAGRRKGTPKAGGGTPGGGIGSGGGGLLLGDDEPLGRIYQR